MDKTIFLEEIVRSKYWFVPLSFWSLLLLSGVFTRVDLSIMDKKGTSLMWITDQSTGTLGTRIINLNCGRVLIPNLVAIKTLAVTMDDVSNQHTLGSCYLISDNLAHIELGGRSFELDISRPRTIDGNDLLLGAVK